MTARGLQPAPELCVVVPVLNERDNVAPLVERLRATLEGVAWEVVFVDDGSTDGTREAVAAIGRGDNRVRLLYRFGRRGLASAFIEGVQCSVAPYVAAMDGDLQHDESLLPDMLAALKTEPIDVVVGSRYVAGGDLGKWDKRRASMSDMATRLSRLVLRAEVTDPMSGFFMLPRAVFARAAPRLSAIGFKILLDLLASLPEPPRVRELPYTFRVRVAGESKLDAGVLFDFALLLLDKLMGGVVPVRFVIFAMIGAVGLIAHLVVLRLGLQAGLEFSPAQAVATASAIVGNFVLNNMITFRDRKLRGKRVLPGLVVFAAVCSIGAVANLNIAALMVNAGHQAWWTAGVVGAAMSLVWNYAVGSTLTWRR
ncbi:MAG: glycosyltransferase family 2 protein [Acetobacteraceae bacterium]